MILLLGGTSDTAPIAEHLAKMGYDVIVSTATDAALDVGAHPRITRRSGSLDSDGLLTLIQQRQAQAIVDATHPYATNIRELASEIARQIALPYLTYVRPPALNKSDNVVWARDHDDASTKAFAMNRTVLLTTGARHLDPYVRQARMTQLPLHVRVLDHPQSIQACQQAGVPMQSIITGRGPFTLTENRQHIQSCRAGVLVTKDGGQAAAVRNKLSAAQSEHCTIVAIQRPTIIETNSFADIDHLARKLSQLHPVNRVI